MVFDFATCFSGCRIRNSLSHDRRRERGTAWNPKVTWWLGSDLAALAGHVWTVVYHSEPGSSHLRMVAHVRFFARDELATSEGDTLLAVCSDGAGSAQYSELGAR